MWHWIGRWHDWAMNDLLPLYRLRAQSRGLHVSYEKAGLTLHHESIPWNADAVVVEAVLKLPAAARRKSDFRLNLSDGSSFAPEQFRPVGGEPQATPQADGERHRLFFRLPVPTSDRTAELFWKTHRLGDVTLRHVSETEYLAGLRLDSPTVFVRAGDRTVAAQTFVSSQCRGLHATAIMRSPHGLAPLADMGLRVRFHDERAGTCEEVPVVLTGQQFASKETLVSAAPRSYPRRIGLYSVEWMLGDHPLASRQLRAISVRAFSQSLQILDTRFLVTLGPEVRLDRQAPQLKEVDRVGPCFVIGSRESGMAGTCVLKVTAQVPGGVSDPVLDEQELLITEGPTPFAPGTIENIEAAQISAFELWHDGRSLGVLSLRPIPEASFNTEGGYRAAPTFTWSSLADDELQERLNRLMG